MEFSEFISTYDKMISNLIFFDKNILICIQSFNDFFNDCQNV